MKKSNVLLFTDIITPYKIPLFNYIHEGADFNFQVIFLAEREENREWKILKDHIKFNYQILPGWCISSQKKEFFFHINRGVFKVLKEYNPDKVVISGYDSLTYWQVFLYCKFFRKKLILWNETTILSTKRIKGIFGLLKRIIIKNADGYIAAGVKAKEYLEFFGAKPEQIYISFDTVDTDFFRKRVFEYRSMQNFIKERSKYPEFLLLYVGRLTYKKGVKQVLQVLNYLQNQNIGFIIVGSGPQEAELKKFCQEKNIKNVFFEGFQQQEVLVKYYALADIFIFPSFYDVWGMVINESLASGLYVLSSKYAGASYDLVKREWNGEIFDPENVKELAILIEKCIKRIEILRSRRDEISKQFCEKFGIIKSANDFLKAVKNI